MLGAISLGDDSRRIGTLPSKIIAGERTEVDGFGFARLGVKRAVFDSGGTHPRMLVAPERIPFVLDDKT